MAYLVPDQLRTLRQSDIGTMLSCGAKLWLSKVEGHERPSSKKMIVGTAFHKGVECLYRSLKLGDRLDLAEAKAASIESIKVGFSLADPTILDLEPTETVSDATVQSGSIMYMALDYYMDTVFPDIASVGEPAAVEERFDLDYRGFHIHGTVDLIDGEANLRDHKFISTYLGKRWPDSYLSQLGRYAWFLASYGIPLLGIKLDAVSYAKATRKKDPIIEHHTYDLAEAGLDMPTLIRMGKESVDSALDMIEAGIFPRGGASQFALGCGTCPFRGAKCQELKAGSAAGLCAAPAVPAPIPASIPAALTA